MAQESSSSIGLYFKDPSYPDKSFNPVTRPDQLQAITQYLTNGQPKQSVPHQSGSGTFDVTFQGLPSFSYIKDDGKGTKVEILFATPKLIHLRNRLMNQYGGSRKASRKSKRSKKAPRRSRRQAK
jgi:hypothetical protein